MPKVAELNAICGELGKDNFLYEPEIVTEISGDGKRESRVVLRVYVNKGDKEVYSQLSMGDFSEVVYQRVKDVYEGMFEDDEIQEQITVDDSAFGFDMDSNKTHIGNFYIFLATIYNMIDLKLDRTPIIDPKGQVQGYVKYSLSFQVFDGDMEIPDLIEYETLNELLGKKLKLNFEIKEGESLPKKLCSRTFCQYEFYASGDMLLQDDEDSDGLFNIGEIADEGSGAVRKKLRQFRTKEVEQKT